MSKDFLDLLRLKRTSPTTFISLTLSERMGNTLPIAYGGELFGEGWKEYS